MPLGQHALWPVHLLARNHLAFGTYCVSARRITNLSAMASPFPCQPNSSTPFKPGSRFGPEGSHPTAFRVRIGSPEGESHCRPRT